MTVQRLTQRGIVRANRYLELFGKLTTVVWCAFIATVILGVDWKNSVEHAVNSGEPVKGAVVLAIVLPTLIFVAAHSATGYARWKLQRELWRRDVARLGQSMPEGE